MKKTTQTLTLVFSVVLLLVFVTASGRARSNPTPAPPVQAGEISAQIRWKKDMGLIPMSPGSNQASTSACSAFYISGSTLGAFGVKSETVGYSQPSTKQAREEGEYYVCSYSMQVPVDRDVFVGPQIGDANLLPKKSQQSYYWTDQWIGGTNSRPLAGWRRGFVLTYIPVFRAGSKAVFFRFEMTYVKGGIPKPTLDSASEKGASPLLSRASSFAGAWRGKFGDGGFELVLQQSGAQVTGHLNINSVIYVIKEGRTVGNTLLFLVARPGYGGVPDQPVGNAELVMDEGEKSFTGKILNVDVSGTLLTR